MFRLTKTEYEKAKSEMKDENDNRNKLFKFLFPDVEDPVERAVVCMMNFIVGTSMLAQNTTSEFGFWSGGITYALEVLEELAEGAGPLTKENIARMRRVISEAEKSSFAATNTATVQSSIVTLHEAFLGWKRKVVTVEMMNEGLVNNIRDFVDGTLKESREKNKERD